MKKSDQVPATLILAIVAGIAVTGCSGTRRECHDATGKVLPGTDCSSGRAGARWVNVRTGGFGGSSGFSSSS
ncbi:MAG: hypothetical protein IT206_00875 [Fimbriimonadaceae bacterium]|nr:hypothetical protein [Fimbriimonadaceae bacterium]